jgi:RNA polymerase sigma factor (sigma-70 family)
MATKQVNGLIHNLRKVFLRTGGAGPTDGDLLERFVLHKEESAFEALMRRHGPMVLGVCRRILGNEADAEDAFQATFLVLVRKAASIKSRALVGNWLHGVAHSTALKARAMNNKRRTKELRAAAQCRPESASEVWQQLQALLDEELGRLPENLRVPIVLCDLEGKTIRQAAQQLGWPQGTVASRLARGRTLLAKRLRCHGLNLSGGALAAVICESVVSAAVPAPLASSTIKAVAWLADGSTGAGVVSAKVIALTEGVIKAMLFSKLRLATVLLMLLTLLGFETSKLAMRALRAEPQQEGTGQGSGEKKARPAAQPAAKPGPGTLLLGREGGAVVLTPEGKEVAELKDTGLHGLLSPDGTRAAFVVAKDGPPPDAPVESFPLKVVVRKLGAAEPSAVVDLPAKMLTLSWTQDGKRLLVTKMLDWAWTTFETVVLDPDTGQTEPLDLPAGVRILDCSRDGKTFLVFHQVEGRKKRRLGLVAKGDKDVRELTELKTLFADNVVGRLSPDGTKVLYTDADPEEKRYCKWGWSSKPYLLDVATRKRTPLAEFPENALALGVAWSPNGKQVAYTWMQLHPELAKNDRLNAKDATLATESHLIVTDADGRNAKTVMSRTTDNFTKRVFGSIDWR